MDIRNVIVLLEDTPYQNLLKSVESKLDIFEFDQPKYKPIFADDLIQTVLSQLIKGKYIFDYRLPSPNAIYFYC